MNPPVNLTGTGSQDPDSRQNTAASASGSPTDANQNPNADVEMQEDDTNSTTSGPSGLQGNVGTNANLKSTSQGKSAYNQRRQQEWKARGERIKRALWPQPEHLRDFKGATGQEPDFKRLWSSTRWRDLWMRFDAAKNPTTKDREDLRKLALELHTKGKQGKRGSGPPPNATSKTTAITLNKKRKTRSLSLERSGSNPPTPVSKQPRVTPAPETSSSTPTKLVPTIVEATEAMGDMNVIQDETDEPTLDDVAPGDVSGEAADYASKAKGAARKDYPYILYVHEGNDERKTMSRETWNCLYEKINTACMDLIIGEKDAPKIEWSGFAKGVGLIAPLDERSRDIMQKLVADTEVAEYKFRAWAKGEKGRWVPLSIKIPAFMKKETVTAQKIMQMAVLMNKLPEKSYIIRSCHVIQPGKERLLRIGADEHLVTRLKQLKGEIYVAAAKLEVHFNKARLLPTTET